MRKNFFAIRPIHTLFAGLLSAVILVGLSLPAKAGAEMTLSGKGTKLAYASTASTTPARTALPAMTAATGMTPTWIMHERGGS